MAVLRNISSKAIIDKLYRDLNLQEESRWHDMIDWFGEALDAIGSFSQLSEEHCVLTIEDHKAHLPCNVYKIIQTEYGGKPMGYATATNFSKWHVEGSRDLSCISEFKYKVNNNWFQTELREGKVDLYFKAFPIDEDGFPMVPDDFSFKQALYWYSVVKLMEGGFKHPNPEIGYGLADSKWQWYCGQARARGNMMGGDKLDAFFRALTRMIPQPGEWSRHFSTMSRGDHNLNL